MLSSCKTLARILSLGKEYKYWMLFASGIAFLTIGSGIGLMMTSAYLIAMAAIQTPVYQVQVAIVGVRFFGISRGIFRYIERLVSHQVTFKLLANLRVWFFQSLIPLVPSKLSNLTSGDILTRSIEDIENLEHIFIKVISPVIVFVLTTMLMFALLLLFGINYALIFCMMFIISAISIPLLTFLLSRKIGSRIVTIKSALKEFTIDGISGINELIMFGQKEKWQKEFDLIQTGLINAEQKMNRIMSLHEGLSSFAMNITVAMMLFVSIPDVASHKLNGVYLSVITIGIMASFEIISQIPLAFQYLTKTISAGNRLFEITNETGKSSDFKNDTEVNTSSTGIKLENICFSYANNLNTLSEISFEISPQKKIAIVGESGSGKSTIVNLISALWKINDGIISLAGKNYNILTEEQIRNYISVVPQKVHLFTGTIKENLTIAKQDVTESQLYSALEKVDLKNFVERLPAKLNTNIGEFGKQLSGGEAKRLSIARALLKDAPIFIFDEITSHVDSITEKKILNTIKNIPADKGVLFITHRITGMEMFDEIIFLSQGKIVERGTHNQLITNSFFYNLLLNAQKTL